MIAAFDPRTSTKVGELTCHSDYISSFLQVSEHQTVATSGDGTLSCWDLRKVSGPVKGAALKQAHPALVKRSDELEDELLSSCLIKHGKKVVCGTQGGTLNIWSTGTWGDFGDR